MEENTQPAADMESKMLAAICECREQFRQNSEDSFLSTVLEAQCRKMEELLEEWRSCQDRTVLAEKWNAERIRMQEAVREEEEHPSFDWYDEHYQEKIYIGMQSACEAMLRLLEGEEEATVSADTDAGSP